MDSKKILILRLSAIGDVLRTLPAVKALKEYYPSSSITWIVEEPSKTLLESQPEIDEVILFPRKRWTEWNEVSKKDVEDLMGNGEICFGSSKTKV